MRLLVRSVLEFNGDQLTDDATLILVRWDGPGASPVTRK